MKQPLYTERGGQQVVSHVRQPREAPMGAVIAAGTARGQPSGVRIFTKQRHGCDVEQREGAQPSAAPRAMCRVESTERTRELCRWSSGNLELRDIGPVPALAPTLPIAAREVARRERSVDERGVARGVLQCSPDRAQRLLESRCPYSRVLGACRWCTRRPRERTSGPSRAPPRAQELGRQSQSMHREREGDARADPRGQ